MTAMGAARRFRRVRQVGSDLGGYLGLAIVVAVVIGLVALGVLPRARWEPFTDIRVWQFLGQGLLVTLQIGLVSLVASLALSVPLALARISLPGPLRLPVVGWIELIRATPVLALILFTVLFMPRSGLDIDPVWAATIGLTVYTSAVLAEVVRAGVVSIPAGEVAAARSLGLSYLQTMRLVVLPQAISRMAPAIVSQCITLVKDTSLASIAAVSELVGYARSSWVFFGNIAETLFVVACLFFLINYTLSRIARRLEYRRPAQERVAVPVDVQPTGGASAAP
jgi:His/Glu/Gln/Arg/opine family amino acid ABC transporter permease subunit